MTSEPHIVLVLSDPDARQLIERNILVPAGYRVSVAANCENGEALIRSVHPDLMILGDDLGDGDYLEFASKMIAAHPTLAVVLFTKETIDAFPLEVVRLGLVDWLTAPLHPEQVLAAVRRGLERSSNWEERLNIEARRQTGALVERVSELETLASVGQAVTAELDIDRVLKVVVEAAVRFTSAEEGSLLLLDGQSGELYMRAALNFQDEFVQTFRLPVQDTLAGGVLADGEPVFINSDTPQKILTSYLVYALIYVPLKVRGRVIGVLGVDHRSGGHSFNLRALAFLSALADYAAIAIENAQLYADKEFERSKLETVLTQIDDGVIVFDDEERIVLINKAVRKAFDLGDDLLGLPLEQVFDHQDLLKILRGEMPNPFMQEISSDKGHIFNVQVTEIADVATVATLQDITYLKELDRVKSDFVNAVSHDLRSPLTAIMGYVDLIERSGDVTELQAKFIRRVQSSVHTITDLIDGLLDLGRIEVGDNKFAKEVSLAPILKDAVDGIQNQLEQKNLSFSLEVAKEMPIVIGDPIQLRQMLDNLLGNAVKYTPEGGEIKFSAMQENGQFLFQVVDEGIGIPPKDQARIFDRFYRASNTPDTSQGTGLGLAIVKSIVENHRGRIWVDSIVGEGSTFTVVLPIIAQKA